MIGHKSGEKKSFKDVGLPSLLASLGIIAKSGKQVNCRNYR